MMSTMLPVSGALITGGSDSRIRFWDLNKPKSSYIISDPKFKACHYYSRKNQPSSSAGASSNSPRTTVHTKSPKVSVASLLSTSTDASILTNMPAPPLATYNHRVISRTGSTVIEEQDCSAQFAEYLIAHHCTLDQQSVATAHHDCITDLLQINQYLISAGRNGTVKVWR